MRFQQGGIIATVVIQFYLFSVKKELSIFIFQNLKFAQSTFRSCNYQNFLYLFFTATQWWRSRPFVELIDNSCQTFLLFFISIKIIFFRNINPKQTMVFGPLRNHGGEESRCTHFDSIFCFIWAKMLILLPTGIIRHWIMLNYPIKTLFQL